MKRKINFFLSLLALVLFLTAAAQAQTSAFSYQGRLADGANPSPTGAYKMKFSLFASPNGNDQVGSTLTFDGATGNPAPVEVVRGVFTVRLDFSEATFAANTGRYLEISVYNTVTGQYVALTPRQELLAAPYSVRTLNANAADTLSAACVGCVTNEKINSLDGAKVTGAVANATNATTAATAENVTGVVAIANGGTGSATQNFVDLTTAQTGIAGDKTFAATISANAVDSATQYNITGSRVLSITGTNNLFAGVDAGIANSTGNQNTFVGTSAGQANTTGSNNTAVGRGADFGTGTLSYATVVGAGALVNNNNTIVLGRTADTVQVPGNLVVTGTFTAPIDGASITDLNASNIASGTLADARLSSNVATLSGAQTFTGVKTFSGGISGSGSGLTNLSAANLTGVVPIANGGTGSSTQNFVDLSTNQTVAGDKTFSSAVNTAVQYNIGGSRVLSVAGTNNLFAGVNAGVNNTGGEFNLFVGRDAGLSNMMGGRNSFVGMGAGQANTSGSFNSFFGRGAGFNSTTGSWNSFFGRDAGLGNSTGSNNTLVGNSANVGAGNLTFATALGSGAVVNSSSTVVLGRTADTVQVPGNLVVTGSITGASKNFKIDHPLDPLNKTLTYTAIESPNMMNVYNGNITTDASGVATIVMPDYFESLNRDFRYQLTVIGQFAQAIVLEKVKGNRFVIKTDKPNVEVSWQITGIRQDRFAEDNRVPNVQEKSAAERNKCLYEPACQPK